MNCSGWLVIRRSEPENKDYMDTTDLHSALNFCSSDPHVASKESVTDSNYTTALDSKGQANFCEIVQPVKNSPENQYIVQSTVDLGSCDGNIYDRSLKDVVLLNTPLEVNCNRFIDSETSNSRTEKETPAWLLSSIPYDSTNNENNHALRPKNSTHVTHVPKWPGRMDQIIKSELISNADSVDIIPKSPSFPNTMELSKMASFTNDSASLSRPDAIWSEIGSTAYSATVLLAIPECGEADYYAESPQYLTVDDLRAMGLYDDSDDSEEDGELERHSKGDGNEAHAFDNTSEKDQKNRSQNLCSSDVQNGSRPQERIAVSEELRVPDRGVAEETLYTETLADINSFGLFNATSHGIDRVQEKLDAFC
ncbi:hypothetical protein D915_006303 [Fasciola hepatica]|uniref:Uncharacterized protein n=1 Tax=Fasciola hepatica TaxID=6192 RepID=A0A4E0S031_FASHE|nr:hypothetical protein D915_006303 [Fasciola hepatica]